MSGYNANIVEELNLQDIYCKYYFDCLQNNSKILNIEDFSIHMHFIWQKINFITNKFKNFKGNSSSLVGDIEQKINKLISLSKNPSYEIEFISPIISDIEQEIDSIAV